MKRPFMTLVFAALGLGFSGCCCCKGPEGPGGWGPDGAIQITPTCTGEECSIKASRMCSKGVDRSYCSGTSCRYWCRH